MFFCAMLTLTSCGGGGGSSATPSRGSSSEARAVQPVVHAAGTKALEATPAEEAANAKVAEPDVRFPSGPLPRQIVIKELRRGSGPPARPGDTMTVKYLAVDKAGEPKFSSWDNGKNSSVTFELGAGRYLPGWDKGVAGMRKGGRREVFFPASTTRRLGSLLYVVDLMRIE